MDLRRRGRCRPFRLFVTIGLALDLVLLFGTPARAENANVSVAEGDFGHSNVTFIVSLSVPMSEPVTVEFFTSDGTARAGSDYEETRGKVLFRSGETRKVIDVPVLGDTIPEGDEVFYFNLPGSRAQATIVDDEPAISVGGISITEGNDATSEATFVVTLFVPSAGAGAPTGGRDPRPVTVTYSTSDGTAKAGTDYAATSGTLHFAAGEKSKLIRVPVAGDVFPENDETFFVNLFDPTRGQVATVQGTGIILNDDAVAFIGEPSPAPSGSVRGGAVAEGLIGVTAAGTVIPFGGAALYSPEALAPSRAVVGASSTPTDQGYWLSAADGGIFAFGDAPFLGSTAEIDLNHPVVGLAATPSGKGYWLVTAAGGVFALGDARFFGSTGGRALDQPIVGMAATPSGEGYWLMGRNGLLFAFGDAPALAPKEAVPPDAPIVGLTL